MYLNYINLFQNKNKKPSEVKEYLYAPHLKSLDFFEEIYGDFLFFENRYDKVHRFLFGVNNH